MEAPPVEIKIAIQLSRPLKSESNSEVCHRRKKHQPASCQSAEAYRRACSYEETWYRLEASFNSMEDEKDELGTEHDGTDKEDMPMRIQIRTVVKAHGAGKGNNHSQQSSEFDDAVKVE